jgi:hypothetical protein
MRKRLIAIALGSGTAVALALGTTAAMAVNATWTVKPGGSFSFAGSAQVKDTKTGTIAKCSSVKLAGTLKKGSGLSGTGIASISSASFSKCNVGGIGVTVTVHGLPWKLNALSYNSTAGVTTGSISGIDLVASNALCHAVLDGTGAGKDNGVTKLTYTNSTGKIKLLASGGNLHSYAVKGCAGLIANGDPQQATGGGLVSPLQKITSP